jgi:hypothetical protein
MQSHKSASTPDPHTVDLHIHISDPDIIRYLKKFSGNLEAHTLEILRVGVCALESSESPHGTGAAKMVSEKFSPSAGKVKRSTLGDDERMCKCRKDLEEMMDEYAEKWN